MARRKLSKQSEFKPDPRQSSLSGLFHVTQLQKQRMLKWTLYVLTGILLLTIQDVIMSRVSIFGATTDLPVVIRKENTRSHRVSPRPMPTTNRPIS